MAPSIRDISSTLGQKVRSLFHLNFFRAHLLYFILVILISSVTLHGSSTPSFQIGYTDALYLCTSAMCNVGLNSVNLSGLTGFQQSILFVLMILGDLTVVTISVVVVRRFYFSKQMSHLVEESSAGRQVAEDIEEHQGSGEVHRQDEDQPQKRKTTANKSSQSGNEESTQPLLARTNRETALKWSHASGYGSFPAPWELDQWKSLSRIFRSADSGGSRKHHYLSFRPELDHKGRLVSLTDKQRSELGGVEYRALKVLTWLLPGYTIFWVALVMVALVPYTTYNSATSSVIRHAQPEEQNPGWWAVFATYSGYSNTGLNLLNSNMIPLRRDYFVLIFTGTAILFGNTLYPVFLRLNIWLLSKVVRKHSEIHHSLSFLLQHPRRCYLLLFPGKHTWILFAVQSFITLLAWAFWMILAIDQPEMDPGMPYGQRTMDGLYQALGLRSGGFYIIKMSDISPALQFFYLIVMYISAYPIMMSLRQSNIYEERSLGQDDSSKFGTDDDGSQSGSRSQLGVHIKRQLAYDLWWLLAAMFIVSIIEHEKLRDEAPGFFMFSIIFEVVSAYGTIGLTLGLPNDDYSFSGAWHVLSKLILVLVMLRGRHRILPMAVDRAVLLPGQELMDKLDKEYSKIDTHRRQEIEGQIREDERGEQAEARGSHQQDPEHNE